MRSKSPLALMEQLVMVLVFALAAALCLRVFVFSDQMSERSETVDWAVMECQNAAETLKSVGSEGGDMALCLQKAADALGGTMSQGLVQVCYDRERSVLSGNGGDCVYVLELQGLPVQAEGLMKANVRVAAVKDISVGGSGEPLFSIDVAWQEVSGNG